MERKRQVPSIDTSCINEEYKCEKYIYIYSECYNRKYPTEANINLRKAEELEKSQRGEVIKQRSSHVQVESKVAQKHKKRRKRLGRAVHDVKNIDCTRTDGTEGWYRGIRPFPGIGML